MDQKYIHHKEWDEIAYPFLNFNGADGMDAWLYPTDYINQS